MMLSEIDRVLGFKPNDKFSQDDILRLLEQGRAVIIQNFEHYSFALCRKGKM